MKIYREYVAVALADFLDDVDCSLSTISDRSRRLEKMEEQIGAAAADRAGDYARKISSRTQYLASGAPNAMYEGKR
jgi:hypothetical protein